MFISRAALKSPFEAKRGCMHSDDGMGPLASLLLLLLSGELQLIFSYPVVRWWRRQGHVVARGAYLQPVGRHFPPIYFIPRTFFIFRKRRMDSRIRRRSNRFDFFFKKVIRHRSLASGSPRRSDSERFYLKLWIQIVGKGPKSQTKMAIG